MGDIYWAENDLDFVSCLEDKRKESCWFKLMHEELFDDMETNKVDLPTEEDFRYLFDNGDVKQIGACSFEITSNKTGNKITFNLDRGDRHNNFLTPFVLKDKMNFTKYGLCNSGIYFFNVFGMSVKDGCIEYNVKENATIGYTGYKSDRFGYNFRLVKRK